MQNSILDSVIEACADLSQNVTVSDFKNIFLNSNWLVIFFLISGSN